MTNINELRLQVEKIRGAITRLEDKVLSSDLPEYKELLDMQVANLEATEALIADLTKSVKPEKKAGVKRPKLTPAQEKTYNRIKSPQMAYKNKRGESVYSLYIDGASESSGSWVMNGDVIGCLENSSTLKALEKKGYIEIVRLGGALGDEVKIVDGFEMPEVYAELSEVTIQYGSDKYGYIDRIHTLPGQEKQSHAAHNHGRGKIVYVQTVEVKNKH